MYSPAERPPAIVTLLSFTVYDLPLTVTLTLPVEFTGVKVITMSSPTL